MTLDKQIVFIETIIIGLEKELKVNYKYFIDRDIKNHIAVLESLNRLKGLEK